MEASEEEDCGLKNMTVLTPRIEGILRDPLDLFDLCDKKLVGFLVAILNNENPFELPFLLSN